MLSHAWPMPFYLFSGICSSDLEPNLLTLWHSYMIRRAHVAWPKLCQRSVFLSAPCVMYYCVTCPTAHR